MHSLNCIFHMHILTITFTFTLRHTFCVYSKLNHTKIIPPFPTSSTTLRLLTSIVVTYIRQRICSESTVQDRLSREKHLITLLKKSVENMCGVWGFKLQDTKWSRMDLNWIAQWQIGTAVHTDLSVSDSHLHNKL